MCVTSMESPLVHRSDDTVEAFERRMVEHAEKTAAVIAHYRAIGRFREIAGTGSLDEVSTGSVTLFASCGTQRARRRRGL